MTIALTLLLVLGGLALAAYVYRDRLFPAPEVDNSAHEAQQKAVRRALASRKD